MNTLVISCNNSMINSDHSLMLLFRHSNHSLSATVSSGPKQQKSHTHSIFNSAGKNLCVGLGGCPEWNEPSAESPGHLGLFVIHWVTLSKGVYLSLCFTCVWELSWRLRSKQDNVPRCLSVYGVCDIGWYQYSSLLPFRAEWEHGKLVFIDHSPSAKDCAGAHTSLWCGSS